MEGSREQYGKGQLTPKATSRVTRKPTVEAFFTIYTYKKELYIESPSNLGMDYVPTRHLLTPSKISRTSNDFHLEESLINWTPWKLSHSWPLPRLLFTFQRLVVWS